MNECQYSDGLQRFRKARLNAEDVSIMHGVGAHSSINERDTRQSANN